MCVNIIGWEGLDWIFFLAQNRVLLRIVMGLRLTYEEDSLLNSSVTVSFV